MPRVVEAISKTVVSMLTIDVKPMKLIGVSREVMEEALKSLIIGAQKLIHRTNTMWDILLAIQEVFGREHPDKKVYCLNT